MANSFAITAAKGVLTLDANGLAEAVFTVTNVAGRPLRGLAKVKPQGDTKREWLKLDGESECDFAAGGSFQFSVQLKAPPGTRPGKYGFRFDVVSVANPDEDFTEGPVVTAELLPAKPPAASRLWIIPVALMVLLVIATAVVLLVRRKSNQPAPAPSPTPATKASPLPSPGDGKVVQLTEANYEQEVLKSELPVLVHFAAAWAGPSRLLGPVLDAIAREYSGRVKVGRVDVDESPQFARKFNIMTVPTLIVFSKGNEQQRMTGAKPKEEITRILNQQLGSNP